jgi:hypothetical protein
MRAYADDLRARLGDLVVGVYLVGSAATPDFQPATSDIDAFVVMRRSLDARVFDDLKAVHRELHAKTPYGDRLEIEYVTADQLRPWGVAGDSASISPGQQLTVGPSNAAADDLLGARSLAVVLFGPPAEEIFPEVDRETFVASQRRWLDDLTKRDELRPNANDAEYAEWTLNIARCIFGILEGRGCTKAEAVDRLSALAPDLRQPLVAALAARAGEQIATDIKASFRDVAHRAREIAKLV